MKTYLLRRLLAMVPMFFLMTGTYFLIQNYLPGGPVQEAIAHIRGAGGGDGGSGQPMSAEDIAQLRAELERQYGLDKPIAARYAIWLGKIVRLDFGDSIATRRPAMDTIIERIPISLGFGIPGFFLTYIVCVALGVSKALRDGTIWDGFTSILLFVAYSIPSLVLSVVLLLVFCTDRFGMGFFPLGGAYSDNYGELSTWGKLLDYGKHMFLPVLASMLGGFTALTMLMKGSMLDVLQSDFIRTARAKGLGERSVVFKHALRNALLPLLVGIGGFLSAFVAGSIVIETVFSLPGMGKLLIDSLSSRDYNVLMGVAVLQSLIIMAGQLISDISYFLVDPRIDFK